MKVNAAFIFIAPEADARTHRTVVDTPAVSLTVIGVKDYEEAETVSVELAGTRSKSVRIMCRFRQ